MNRVSPSPRSRAGVSLTAKSIFVAVGAGALAWVLTDQLAARGAKRAFETHLNETLNERAVDYRFLLGRSIHAFRETVKVLASQQVFVDHLRHATRGPGGSEPVRHHRRSPPWLPSRSVLRSLGNPHHAVLLDGQDRVREVFTSASDPPPRFLLAPDPRLLALSEEESYLRSEDGQRYVISTKTLPAPGGGVAGRLVIASPIDEEFLRGAYGSSVQGVVTAIVDASSHVVVASSEPESIPPGTRAEDFSERYLTTLQDFFEYGSSEMDFLFASFVSLERVAPASAAFIRGDRLRRGFQAMLIVAVLTLIVTAIARRIERVSARVSDFSRETLGLAPPRASGGDQITVLEERFQMLADEVVLSRETIRREAAEKERRAAESQRRERQLRLLQSVTDAIGVGVMRESGAGFVPANERMRLLGESFRDPGVFASPAGGAEERELVSPDGRRHVFFIVAPSIPLEERVLLVSDVTERQEAAERLRHSYQAQRIVNSILLIAFEQLPLEAQLERALEQVLTLEWLGHGSAGAILRWKAESRSVEFAAGWRLPADPERACAGARRGKCDCAVAAAGDIVFAAPSPAGEETCVGGLSANARYCVPISSGPTVHGVMVLSVDPGHERRSVEAEQLQAIASAIASIFGLSRVEAEKKTLFGQLLQAQKLETVGRLAGGVAHDFNNILSAIMGYAEISLLGAGEDEPLARNLRSVLDSCERARGLTAQLLAFSRSQVLEMRVVSLNALVLSAARILRRLVGEDIAIEIEIDPDAPPPVIHADPVQVEQILFNLVVNARDAMPGGGRVRIRTDLVERVSGPPGPGGAPAPGRYAVLIVSDTGTGIAPEIRDRIFEPFFTTKDPGKGTGLGLSTAYGIVTQHRGFLEVHGSEGQGTEFRVFLPATESPLPAVVLEAEARPVRGSETILVVEDDEALRKLIISFLEPLGYRVLAAASGEEALGLSMFHGGAIDLLVTDVVMPGVNGRDLAAALRAQRPGTSVLFVSGYVKDARIQEALDEGHAHFLQKPVTPSRLAERIRRILDGARVPGPANEGVPPPPVADT